jgi:mannose-6-phosphate isomerase
MELITPAIQHYEWGTTDAIPLLLGRPADGSPWAEAWLGVHERGPATLQDGTSLADFLVSDPAAILGADILERFGELPFLFKILSAAKPLSIQTHPSRDQAQAGFERENAAGVPLDAPHRNYRDSNHKPELICALTEFHALCGFRAASDVTHDFRQSGGALGEIADAIETGGLQNGVAVALRLVSPNEAVRLIADGQHYPTWLRQLANDFPADAGVVVAAMLEHHTLQPGQALYLDAGNVHAYLSGTGLELMANSDNVLRCGLTPKHVDVDELLKVMTVNTAPIKTVEREGHRYATPSADFELQVVSRGVGDLSVGPSIAICTDGTATITSSTQTVELTAGECVFIAANDGKCEVSTEEGTAYCATVPFP